jgi:hypothetical protein
MPRINTTIAVIGIGIGKILRRAYSEITWSSRWLLQRLCVARHHLRHDRSGRYG